MASLDLKRKEVELLRVQVAKQELELRIEERLEEIQRLKEHIEVSSKTELKLKEEIQTLKG